MESREVIANRYQVLERLGEGGMGAVTKVRDSLNGDVLAMKQVLLMPSQLKFASKHTNSDNALALMQEFRVLAGLRHPHIVSVQDFGFDNKMPFYTMQLLDDVQTITAYATDRDMQTKVEVLLELLQALIYLHRHGILHRDLKPDNVLVTKDGKVKVLDFGLARIHDENSSSGDIIAGTLAYMAPELFNKQEASIVSDIYAVGVIAYELFVGKHPHDTGNISGTLASIINHVPDTTMIEPRLADVLDQLLDPDPKYRYQNTHDVVKDLCTATGTDLPTEDVLQRESYLQASRMVGRKKELDSLKTSLNRLEEGKGQAWLIGGESGVGKTRLVDELRTHALVAGMSVLRGQAVEGAGLPYQLWRDPLRHYVLSVEIDEHEASILKEIIPDIEDLLGYDVPTIPPLQGLQHQERLVGTIIELIRRSTSPLVLLLQDLHWANESLLPLQQLLSNLEDYPILIIADYRNDETPDLPGKFPSAQVMTLERLDETSIEKLITAMLGSRSAQPQVIDFLIRETEGNVFFIIELLRVLAEEAGRLSNIGQLQLPEHIMTGGVKAIVQRRLQRLPQNIREWLKPIAVAGRHLDLAVIDQLSSKLALDYSQSENRESILTQCVHAAVMQVENEKWQFAHDKIREVIITYLEDDERKKLHHNVAEAIEFVHPDDEAYHETLLEHWHQAQILDKEYSYLILASQALIDRRGEYERSRQLIDRILPRLEENDKRYVTLVIRKSESYWAQGAYQQTEILAKQSLEIARQNEFVHEQANSLRVLGIATAHQKRILEAREHFSESMELYKQLNEHSDVTALLVNLGNIANLLGEIDKAKQYYKEGLAMFEETKDFARKSITLINLGSLALKQGQYEKALAYYEENLSLGQPLMFFKSYALSLIGATLLRMEDNRSKSSFHEALTIAYSLKAENMMLLALVGIASLRVAKGDYEQPARWAGLANSHPASDLHVQQLYPYLLQELTLNMSEQMLHDEMTYGETLDLIKIITNLLDTWESV